MHLEAGPTTRGFDDTGSLVPRIKLHIVLWKQVAAETLMRPFDIETKLLNSVMQREECCLCKYKRLHCFEGKAGEDRWAKKGH